MVTVYSEEYTKNNDIIDRSFWTGSNANPKKYRDDFARSLRKLGYEVQVSTTHFDTRTGYFLHAVKRLS